MFARASKKSIMNKPTSSQIPNDVFNLIDEIDTVAAPFDESIVVTPATSDDALLVDDVLSASKIQEDSERDVSSDLSVQVSELSTSLDDLAFLEESMKDVPSPTATIKGGPQDDDVPLVAEDDDNKAPSIDSGHEAKSSEEPTATVNIAHQDHADGLLEEENDVHDSKIAVVEEEAKSDTPADKSFMSKMWSSIATKAKRSLDNVAVEQEAAAAAPTLATNIDASAQVASVTAPTPDEDEAVEETKSDTPQDDEFINPFVNIGNRLLDDSEDDAGRQDDSSIDSIDSKARAFKQMLVMVGKVLLFILRVIVQVLGICARNIKTTSIVLLVVALGMYLKTYFPFSVTISMQHQVSAWNSSMMEDLSPPTEVVEEITFAETTEALFDSTMHDLIAMLQVLALSMSVGLVGFSLLGMQTSTTSNQAPTYTKHEDDCSRYDNLNLVELKRALRARNLNTTGIHSHLVDRLVEHDNGGTSSHAGYIDVSVVKRNTTVKILQKKLRERGLPVTGLKDDLISKVWIPARVEELELYKMDELRQLLVENNLSRHGKSKDELIRRLVEAGH